MIKDSDLFLCLKLADKSFYSLYKKGERGEKQFVITPARENQKKNEISLFNCSGEKKELLREILLENQGDMEMFFSLSRRYLSYEVQNREGVSITKGLIEISEEDQNLYKNNTSSLLSKVTPR